MKLRSVVDSDVEVFFDQQLEAVPEAAHAPERVLERFREKWASNRANASNRNMTIMMDDEVAGYVATFPRLGLREVCYWLGRRFWGKGIATRAVTEMLESEEHPIFARVAKSNVASARVLEKCGFVVVREERYFSKGLETDVDEYVLRRDR